MHYWVRGVLTIALIVTGVTAEAQDDTLKKNRIDSLLFRQRGLLGMLAQNLLADTLETEDKDLQRVDVPFQKYEGRVIRSITVQSVEFGSQLNDTGKRISTTATRVANSLHAPTRGAVVRNHLFFREQDRISPFLMGNNERYLRDLPYFQEAHIKVLPVKGRRDSVDVVVLVKDVLSLGGGVATGNPGSRLQLWEDNFMGWGDKVLFEAMYDRTRQQNFGIGAEYTRRNIMGSFIDASVGFLNFNPSLSNNRREEKVAFVRMVKPLVNPYQHWTYAFSAEKHSTSNMFNADSVYHHLFRYEYNLLDAWVGWNPAAYDTRSVREYSRTRYLLSARMINQQFSDKPHAYTEKYHFPFSSVTALLGTISLFRLNFYKTHYVYGFGRKEDLPEGIEASFTSGYVKREGRARHYMGASIERYFVTRGGQYLDYSLKLSSSLFGGHWEDVTAMANVDYFTRLRYLGSRWKLRHFFSASAGTRLNPLLDEPFRLESSYGLPQYNNNLAGGSTRLTVKSESVFFSPWNIFFFKLAPFVFGSATMMKLMPQYGSGLHAYPAVGGGIRTRNESLVFGTIELRASYFPRKDFFNNGYSIQLNTNLRFKYQQNFIRRPEFITVN